MSIRHAVILHGYSLAEHPKFRDVVTKKDGSQAFGKFGDWEHVCTRMDTHLISTGSVRIYGRIPTALKLADKLDASQLIFSTGATWVPWGNYKESEARYMHQCALEIFDRCVPDRLPDWLHKIALFDEISTNTFSTMEYVAEILDLSSPVMLHHVTSANHAPRVMRDAIKVFGGMPNVLLSVVPADTSYGYKSPSDVVIHELGEPSKT